MFEEAFEKLNLTEQEAFRRIVNWLLAHTYLLQGTYAFEDNMNRTNPDYLFVERNFELFQDYLEYAGFHLERDSNYGVIFLSSSYEFNRVKLDKATTLMLYVLRLIYEEEREKLSLSRDIFTTTGDSPPPGTWSTRCSPWESSSASLPTLPCGIPCGPSTVLGLWKKWRDPGKMRTPGF